MGTTSILKYSGIALVPILVAALILFVPLDSSAQDEIDIGASMPQPDRSMDNASGPSTSLANAAGSQGTVVIFWSNQSPWIDRYEERVLALARDVEEQGITFVLINSNDPNAYPQESLSNMRQRADRRNYPMPYLKDTGSQVARAFGASRTPHVFAFDGNRTLVYKGSVDDSPTDPEEVSEHYLRDALTALLQGATISTAETRAFGSTIKFYAR